jgi:hypothetical protein
LSPTQLLFEFLKALIDAHAFPNCADDAYSEDEPGKNNSQNRENWSHLYNLIGEAAGGPDHLIESSATPTHAELWRGGTRGCEGCLGAYARAKPPNSACHVKFPSAPVFLGLAPVRRIPPIRDRRNNRGASEPVRKARTGLSPSPWRHRTVQKCANSPVPMEMTRRAEMYRRDHECSPNHPPRSQQDCPRQRKSSQAASLHCNRIRTKTFAGFCSGT